MRPSIKGNFIRERDIQMPLNQLQRQAKLAGLGVLSKSYIGKVRTEMRKASKSKAAAAAAPKSKPSKPAALPANAGPAAQVIAAAAPLDAERQLRAIVIVLGTQAVRKIIDELEQQLMGNRKD